MKRSMMTASIKAKTIPMPSPIKAWIRVTRLLRQRLGASCQIAARTADGAGMIKRGSIPSRAVTSHKARSPKPVSQATLDSNQRCTLCLMVTVSFLLRIRNTHLRLDSIKKDPSRHDAQDESVNQIQLATSLRKY